MRTSAILAIFLLVPAAALKGSPCAPPYEQNLQNCDFSKREDLAKANFSNANLTGASFDGATLTGATFAGAMLTRATFTNATLDQARFDSATLDGADFSRATIREASFQYAHFSCTKLDHLDLSDATFGPQLKNDAAAATCRTSFAGSTMNCEFIPQWKELDLTGAIASGCFNDTRMQHADFSGGIFTNAIFSTPHQPANLTGTRWGGANLIGAAFTFATLSSSDFSTRETNPTQLTGADFTYVAARGSKFDYANFSAQTVSGQPLSGANFAYSDLGGSTFSNCNLSYANFAAAELSGTPDLAFTNAVLTGARFAHANLSAANLSTAGNANGADFSNANLTNVNLKNLRLRPSSFVACTSSTIQAADLRGAFLCGATIDRTDFTCANLTAAFMPQTSQTVRGPGGEIQCEAVTVSYAITTGRAGANANGCFTTCPDGTPGPCSGAQWNQETRAIAIPCCSAGQRGPCPAGKRPGFSCSSNCDCISRQCSGGFCLGEQ